MTGLRLCEFRDVSGLHGTYVASVKLQSARCWDDSDTHRLPVQYDLTLASQKGQDAMS